MEVSAQFDLEPVDAVKFIQAKGLSPTFNWYEMLGDEHDAAFTVAKMMDTDLLATVQERLGKALQEGKTFADFQKELIPELQKAGWWGKKDVIDPSTGLVVKAQLGSATRLETIFRSNLQSAYSVGHWDKIAKNAKDAPFLLYDAVDDFRVRPEHAALDNQVHPVYSDFWKTHFPPNGWNCRCGVIQLDEDDIKDLGLTPIKKPDIKTKDWTNPKDGTLHKVPIGTDPGWDHNPGLARMKNLLVQADDKAKSLLERQRKAVKAAQGKQAVMQAAYKADIAKDLEVQKLSTVKAQAQQAIDDALISKEPYLAPELKKIIAKNPGIDPTEALAKAQGKAAYYKGKALEANYKKAKIAGKEPSPASAAHVATLSDEAKGVLEYDIDVKSGQAAAQEAILAIATGKAPKQMKLQQTLFEKFSIDGTAAGFGTDYKGLVKAIQDEADAQMATGKISAVISGYKKKVLEGKIPSPQQQTIFNGLDDAAKAKVLADIDAKKAKANKATSTIEPSNEAANIDPAAPDAPVVQAKVVSAETEFNPDSMTKIGGQGGSNPGGLYQDTDTGVKWYIKEPKSIDNGRNEVLGAKIYEAAGIDAPQVQMVNFQGKDQIASKIIDGLESNSAALKAGAPGAAEGFMVDAWLANWDVVGQGFDNLLLKGGRAVRVDTGGTLRYRAQGTLKGTEWGDIVQEIESLRSPQYNSQSASVFGSMTQEQLIESARKVALFTDDKIDDLIKNYGPLDSRARKTLAATLKARREFILEAFPEARTRTPAAIVDTGERVTRIELENVNNSRINGYAVPTDKDSIEDQSVLVWHKTDANKNEITAAYFKVKGEAAERMLAQTTTAPANYNDVHEKIKKAATSIRHRIDNNETSLGSAISKLQIAANSYDEMIAGLKAEVAAGTRAQKSVTEIQKKIEPYIKQIKDSIAASAPVWDKNLTELYEEFNIGAAKLKAPEAGTIRWLEKENHTYNLNQLDKSYHRETSSRAVVQTKVFEAEIDGVKIRYFPDIPEVKAALRGRVDIEVPGNGLPASSKIFETIEQLGIDSTRASAASQEMLYLQQLGYIHRLDKKADFIAAIKAGDTAKAKALISKASGVDIDNVHYRPEGEHQAFEHGRRTRYRPELLGHPEWEGFEKNHRVIHRFTSNGSVLNNIKILVNGGGQMAPTADKIRRGVSIDGMSPGPDLNSGGATYFFTRIKTAEQAKVGSIVWKAKVAARSDAISYDGDKYGRTFDYVPNAQESSGPDFVQDYVQTNRQTKVQDLMEIARSTNETIVKDTLSIFDDLDYINAANNRERIEIIKFLKNEGYSTWPDGRSVTEVVRVNGELVR